MARRLRRTARAEPVAFVGPRLEGAARLGWTVLPPLLSDPQRSRTSACSRSAPRLEFGSRRDHASGGEWLRDGLQSPVSPKAARSGAARFRCKWPCSERNALRVTSSLQGRLLGSYRVRTLATSCAEHVSARRQSSLEARAGLSTRGMRWQSSHAQKVCLASYPGWRFAGRPGGNRRIGRFGRYARDGATSPGVWRPKRPVRPRAMVREFFARIRTYTER